MRLHLAVCAGCARFERQIRFLRTAMRKYGEYARIMAMQLTINGTPRTFDQPVATVADVVRALALEGKRIAVERNGEIVPRSRYVDTKVSAADRLEIVGAVGGG